MVARNLSTKFFDVDDRFDWDMILSGEKSQVMTVKPLVNPTWATPTVVMGRHGNDREPLALIDMRRQMLFEITQEDVEAEGFTDLTAFKEDWMRRTGASYFSPNERVWVHSVEVLRPYDPEHLEAMVRVVNTVYPQR